MQHIAVDLGGRESQVCARTVEGKIVHEGKVVTRDLGRFLKHQPHSRVVLETCAEAFSVADAAVGLGHEVRVVPATLVRSLGVGARRTKTDVRDARVLSEVSCRVDLPSVHVPTELARQRRSMCGVREQLVSTRTALVNSVRGWARTQLLRIRSGEPPTLPRRLRTVALARPDGLPECVERMLVVIESLNEQIALADKEQRQLAQRDPLCKRLMSVPGVGPIISLRFTAAIDNVSRFPNAHSVQAYLGLTPGENSSCQRKHRTSITKAGPASVRRALVQGAWSLRCSRPADPIAQWAAEIEKRRGKQIATVAVARKLAGVLYALWRDGTRYEPNHARRNNRAAA